MRPTRAWMSLLLVMALILSTSGLAMANGKAGAAPKHGTIDPFALHLTALKGPTQTDLTLSVSSIVAGYTVPDSLRHVQLKSFDAAGELVYTKNHMNLASPGGQASMVLTDVERHQTLKTQVRVRTAQTVSEKILDARVTVLLRPDLTFDGISAPEQVMPNANFAVTATIKELNGDVGTDAKVTIYNGATVLDVADISVNSGGTATAAFLLALADVGSHTLRAVISDASVAEYDTSNNETTFTVEVGGSTATKSMQYWMQYQHLKNYEYHYEGWIGMDTSGPADEFQHHYETSEWFQLGAWTSDFFAPQGALSFQVATESGSVMDLQVNLPTINYNTYWDSYYGQNVTYGNAWVHDAASNTTIGFHTNSIWGSQVWLYRSAGDVTYSYRWRDYYGGYYESSDSYSWGDVFWGAESAIHLDFAIPADNGEVYGGSASLTLQPYSYAWDDWYQDYYYTYTYHYWGSYDYVYGYGDGETQL